MTAASAAKNKATVMHSKIVRARGACEDCGSTQNLQCAHIVSRRYAHTRTDLDNAFCLCAGCHMYFTEWPLEFAAFVTAKIGAAKYRDLRGKSLRRGKVDWSVEVDRLKPLLAAVNA